MFLPPDFILFEPSISLRCGGGNKVHTVFNMEKEFIYFRERTGRARTAPVTVRLARFTGTGLWRDCRRWSPVTWRPKNQVLELEDPSQFGKRDHSAEFP